MKGTEVLIAFIVTCLITLAIAGIIRVEGNRGRPCTRIENWGGRPTLQPDGCVIELNNPGVIPPGMPAVP